MADTDARQDEDVVSAGHAPAQAVKVSCTDDAAVIRDELFEGWLVVEVSRMSDRDARLQTNPEPLAVVQRRDNVTALAAIRGRSREDRMRVWLALGGTEDDFPEPSSTTSELGSLPDPVSSVSEASRLLTEQDAEPAADADQLRDLISLYVPAGFRDDDGVWHDGPHRAAALATLDRLVAHRDEWVDVALGRGEQIEREIVARRSAEAALVARDAERDTWKREAFMLDAAGKKVADERDSLEAEVTQLRADRDEAIRALAEMSAEEDEELRAAERLAHDRGEALWAIAEGMPVTIGDETYIRPGQEFAAAALAAVVPPEQAPRKTEEGDDIRRPGGGEA